MMEKLKCVIVDDGQSMSTMSNFCKDVPFVDVARGGVLSVVMAFYSFN